MQLLARRLRKDLEPRFERVVAVDQRQMRLAPLEQPGEQPLEVIVDLFERCAQPFAPLAVEVADRAAQPADRLAQFLLLRRVGAVLALDPFEFFRRDQVDRTDPFAAGGEAIHILALGFGRADRVLFEFKALRQQRGWALEAFARDARHLDPPTVLVFRAFGEAGAILAGLCQRLIGGGEPAIGLLGLGLGSAHRLFGRRQFARQPFADLVALFDLPHQPLGLGCGNRAVLLDFLGTDFHFRQPPRGIAAARLPVGHVAALRRRALARHRQRLVVAGEFGGACLQRCAGSLVLGPRGLERSAARFGIGKGVAPGLRGIELRPGRLECLGMLGFVAGQFLEPRGQPFARRFGLVERAQCLAFRIGGSRQFAFARHEIALQLRQFFARHVQRRLRVPCGFAQRGQSAVEFGKAVLRFQAGRFRGSFTANHEAIPAAQLSGERHQRVAGGKGTAVVALGNMHQREQCPQFVGGALDMG